MRIDGEWALFDDGVTRPIISGEVLTADGSWAKFPFLVDTGADRTVFSAPALARLGLQPIASQDGISGLGGRAECVVVDTQVRLSRENASKVVFRGQYAAVTEVESLDTCVLGRDITGLFAIIADQPGNVVCLLGRRHHYIIKQQLNISNSAASRTKPLETRGTKHLYGIAGQPMNLHLLFVCDANRLRSPTAETIFSGRPHLEVKSAGAGLVANVPLSLELLEWADLIFVMEKRQRNIIHSRFKEIYQRKRIICLYIPDDYEFMDPELIELLEAKVTPYLEQSLSRKDDE